MGEKNLLSSSKPESNTSLSQVNLMMKPLMHKKKPTPPEYLASLLEGVKAKTKEVKEKVQAANDKRARVTNPAILKSVV